MADPTGEPTRQRRLERIRTFWHTRVVEPWRDLRWLVIGTLWLSALGLGYAGFVRYSAAHDTPSSFWDNLYLTLQLFTLESGSLSGPISWELEVARWLAPAVAGWDVYRLPLFSGRHSADRWFYRQVLYRGRRRRSGSVVACGDAGDKQHHRYFLLPAHRFRLICATAGRYG